MSEQLILTIANQFGIKPASVKKIRKGVYRVTSTGGVVYSLKRMPKSPAQLRWIDRVLRGVRKKGIRLAWRNPQTPEGRKLYAASPRGGLYVLTPWIAGRMPSPRSLSEMRACGVALGRFHRAGSGAIKRHFAYNQVGAWPSILRARQRDLQNKVAKAKRNGFARTAINRFVRLHGPEMLRYANQAKALLRSSGYFSHRHRPRKRGVLCHGDGGPSNFVMNASGTYLLDFETLHVDLPAYDLYRVIYNSCKDHRWNFKIAKAILTGYRQASKLSKTDYKLIGVWLRFPRTSCLVLSSYERFPLTEKNLHWALSSERKITRFLQKLKQYAATHSS